MTGDNAMKYGDMPRGLPMPPYRFQPTPATSSGYTIQGPVLVGREIDDALRRSLLKSVKVVGLLGDSVSGL